MLIEHVHPILLIEDEPDDASFVRRALEKSRIVNRLVVCQTAKRAKSYLEQANGDYPALALVDVHLPNGESGIDFLRWLRKQPAPLGILPVIVFTISQADQRRAEAVALKWAIYLQKPATEQGVANAVQTLGFVVTTTVAGGLTQRVIEPR
jgi:CheY-like chemotaxis protein